MHLSAWAQIPRYSYGIDARQSLADASRRSFQCHCIYLIPYSTNSHDNAALRNYLMLFVMNPPQTSPEACHNCRRRRLKCDRALPQCLKCIERGQECLGYQNLFRWEQGVASRGKMAGRTFGDLTKHRASHDNSSPHSLSPVSHSSQPLSRGRIEVSLLASLTDPLVRDVNHTSRKYLVYCELLLPSYLGLTPTNIRSCQ